MLDYVIVYSSTVANIGYFIL